MAVKQVQRYIRLNELVPDLMKLMDEKKAGALLRRWELSYIGKKNQNYIAVAMISQQSSPSQRRQSVCGNWTKRSCSTGM